VSTATNLVPSGTPADQTNVYVAALTPADPASGDSVTIVPGSIQLVSAGSDESGSDAPGRIHLNKGRGGQDRAGLAVQHVDLSVGVRMDQQRAVFATPQHIGEQHGTARTQRIEIMRIDGNEPACVTCPNVPGKQAGGPFVVTRPRFRVPRRWRPSPIKHESPSGVVGEIAGQPAAALLPGLWWPTSTSSQ
jgi:hypothetical protein